MTTPRFWNPSTTVSNMCQVLRDVTSDCRLGNGTAHRKRSDWCFLKPYTRFENGAFRQEALEGL
jgi:hypothetical protein